MRWSLPLAVATIAVLAGCLDSSPAPKPNVDDPLPGWPALLEPLAQPLANGNLTWKTTDYALGNTTVGGPDAMHDGYEYDALIRGTFTIPDGVGPFPLAVFLHGQHQYGSEQAPYRNDRGYVYLMEHLASYGIAVASVLGYEVNRYNGAGDTGMWARGELVLATVDAFNVSEFAPRLDFSRVGIMGHSRGGEGVVTAAEVNAGRAAPVNLTSIIALAPTDFAYRNVPNIPFLTLAPYCDGDVYNLHGLRQFDQSRYVDSNVVKVQLLVMGANHNNYNTMWGEGYTGPVTSNGDDAPFGRHQNTHCDLSRDYMGGRLSLEETYAESKLHLGGFLRWTLLDDQGMAPYFLGAKQPAEACPGLVACPGAVHVSTMTPQRRDLFWAESTGVVGAPGVAVPDAPVCQFDTCASNVYSSAWMADLQMMPDSASFDLQFSSPLDVRETPILNVRVAVPTNGGINAFGPPLMDVVFTDAKGTATVQVSDAGLFLPPGLVVDPGVGAFGFVSVGGAKVSANAVTIPVPTSIDAGNLTGISFTFTPAGPTGKIPDRILIADAWMNRESGAARTPDGLGPAGV